MLKKFKQDKEVWLKYGEFKMTHGTAPLGHTSPRHVQFLALGMAGDGRKLLQRSLKSLPKREHVEVISKFGIMEFKHGEAERGRTIFENVLTSYPKRTDLWSLLLDHELRMGEVEAVRTLFERIISLNLSSKKMKSFFKRYLDFEKGEGNMKGVEHVKTKAREYVQTKADAK